ncbi:MAG: hypothetical protein WD509_03440 [Candidatus Paceibacterota bacterium]
MNYSEDEFLSIEDEEDDWGSEVFWQFFFFMVRKILVYFCFPLGVSFILTDVSLDTEVFPIKDFLNKSFIVLVGVALLDFIVHKVRKKV